MSQNTQNGSRGKDEHGALWSTLLIFSLLPCCLVLTPCSAPQAAGCVAAQRHTATQPHPQGYNPQKLFHLKLGLGVQQQEVANLL